MMHQNLLHQYITAREYTITLCNGLNIEEFNTQAMPDVSPPKWHLAHTTWFFETFLLAVYDKEYKVFDTTFTYYFNSYYEGVGQFHPRAQRRFLTQPYLDKVKAYREYVDQAMVNLIKTGVNEEISFLITLGINHEQQHQELLLMDVKYNLWNNPCSRSFGVNVFKNIHKEQSKWLAVREGLYEIGASGHDFYFDNEAPRHKFYLQPYQISSACVSNKEYLEFIEDGAYQYALLWLSEGWDWLKKNKIAMPLYWLKKDNQYFEFTLNGLQPLQADRPVLHLSYFEADAYARWKHCRLPTEAEWEVAAEQFHFPKNIGWQWTSSYYSPYPGFIPFPNKAAEYNGKFMSQQMVLRGGSAASPEHHVRYTYRNFFPPESRWMFSTLRLAKNFGG